MKIIIYKLTIYEIESCITLQEDDQLISIKEVFHEGVWTVKAFGAALTLNWVITTDGLADNGPWPYGPTKPTSNTYSSQAAKSLTVVDKLVVIKPGPVIHSLFLIMLFCITKYK